MKQIKVNRIRHTPLFFFAHTRALLQINCRAQRRPNGAQLTLEAVQTFQEEGEARAELSLPTGSPPATSTLSVACRPSLSHRLLPLIVLCAVWTYTHIVSLWRLPFPSKALQRLSSFSSHTPLFACRSRTHASPLPLPSGSSSTMAR